MTARLYWQLSKKPNDWDCHGAAEAWTRRTGQPCEAIYVHPDDRERLAAPDVALLTDERLPRGTIAAGRLE